MTSCIPSAALLLLLAACAKPTDDGTRLLDEARAAVLEHVDDPVSVRFDNTHLAVFVGQGLVCGGTVKTKDPWGEYREFEPYFYARGRGIGLPTYNSALHATLTRECRQAAERAE